ncbi:MAG: FixH family protein [Gammaproteobacteria bacterium]|jgi:uncharacterized protein
MHREREDLLPWYRQFWPWFVIALPLSAVIGGLATVWIAVDHRVSLVADDYYKEGLAINRVLDRERLARQLGLEADITVRNGELYIRMTGNLGIPPQQLTAHLRHPTRGDWDETVILQRTPDGDYRGSLPELHHANWYLRITDPDHHWLLAGRARLPSRGSLMLHVQG